MPDIVEQKGQRLPATYANFYFINGALLVPTYGDEERDAEALTILQGNINDRQVIGIDCRDLVWGLGAIHCLTQQQPLW
jgi:agmatine deiminase